MILDNGIIISNSFNDEEETRVMRKLKFKNSLEYKSSKRKLSYILDIEYLLLKNKPFEAYTNNSSIMSGQLPDVSPEDPFIDLKYLDNVNWPENSMLGLDLKDSEKPQVLDEGYNNLSLVISNANDSYSFESRKCRALMISYLVAMEIAKSQQNVRYANIIIYLSIFFKIYILYQRSFLGFDYFAI